jgi:hypothetical protein
MHEVIFKEDLRQEMTCNTAADVFLIRGMALNLRKMSSQKKQVSKNEIPLVGRPASLDMLFI